MSINKNCIIVIPVYKNFQALKKTELVSLNQCLKILGSHEICFIAPDNFESQDYVSFCKSKSVNVDFKFFNNSFFADIKGYNNLLKGGLFFKKFKTYRYLLIYQLDAFVFNDELSFWCGIGIDYIGAPWFEHYEAANFNSRILGVGNGGFSLRNVGVSLRMIRRIDLLRLLRNFWFNSGIQSLLRFERIVLLFEKELHIKNIEILMKTLLERDIYEDIFWTQFVGESFSDLNVANIELAIKFSFEVNPHILYAMNKNCLPFGCHAWERYNPEFWSKYII